MARVASRLTFYFAWIDVHAIISFHQRRHDKSVTFLETDTGRLPAAANDFSSKYDPYSRECAHTRTHTHIHIRECERGKGRRAEWIMNLHEEIRLPGSSPLSGNRCPRAHRTLRTEIWEEAVR